MPYTSDADTFNKQHNQFFVVLALVALTHELDDVYNWILSGSEVSSYDTISE